MADEGELDLLRAHREGASKFIYFLCIAFAISQTREAVLSWSKLPLGLAVACWAVSFFLGCLLLRLTRGLQQRNYEYSRVLRGVAPASQNPDLVRRGLQRGIARAGSLEKWQIGFLIVGAIFYIAWHVTEMYLRT